MGHSHKADMVDTAAGTGTVPEARSRIRAAVVAAGKADSSAAAPSAAVARMTARHLSMADSAACGSPQVLPEQALGHVQPVRLALQERAWRV